MTTTRRLDIFKDPENANRTDMRSSNLHGSTQQITSDENSQAYFPLIKGIILDPPSSRASARSPLKAVCQPSTSPPKVSLQGHAHILFPPPQTSTFKTDSPSKSARSSCLPPKASHTTLKPTFTSFSNPDSADKENAIPSYHSDNFADFPDPSYGYPATLKRTASKAPSSQDFIIKKPRTEEPSSSALPDPQSLPVVEDDGKKPNHPYAMLIGMSILRSPSRRLTLAQIYKWISDTFTHYRCAESGWQNSIRHNLSLNKAFVKQERPKDDPGKGNYWAIAPGMEAQFLKDKFSRRPTSSSELSMRSSSQQLTSDTSSWPTQTAPVPKPSSGRAENQEPSSDATLIASDAPSSTEEEVEGSETMPPPISRVPPSSPTQTINSSPPIPTNFPLLDDTPSPPIDLGLQHVKRSKARKRKITDIDDSGYFSSVDSSATRHHPCSILPQCDTGRPRIKRGRAEEEIARIRSSSHDMSPSRDPSTWKQTTPSLVSSSPLRHFDTSLMLPPFTPAFKFKLPAKPPASISPNTNLRNHRNKIRELVGSPVKTANLAADEVTFSPAFNIVENESYNYCDDLNSSFSIFADNHDEASRCPSTVSPKRRSWKNPANRTNKTANILADITGTSLNSRNPMFAAQVHDFDSPLKEKANRSPLILGSGDESAPKEDIFGLSFLEDEEPDDAGGFDILQGFQKIGGNRRSAVPAKASRPALGARSNASVF